MAKRSYLTTKETDTIENAKNLGWIILKDPEEQSALMLRDKLIDERLGLGEAYSIALAKELRVIFLANDRQAILLARESSVQTRWLTEILHDALKVGELSSVDEFTNVLDECIAKGLYLSRTQREQATQKARQIKR